MSPASAALREVARRGERDEERFQAALADPALVRDTAEAVPTVGHRATTIDAPAPRATVEHSSA